MTELISICIPTYRRPGLVVEALRSCLAQAYRPLEILVADDSQDDLTEAAISGLERPDGIEIRYMRNVPALGQARNVNKLLAEATGPRLLLLHDDDLLFLGALDRLVDAWCRHGDVAAVYGKRQIVSEDCVPLEAETEQSNRQQLKTVEWDGPQESAVAAALRRQFPNDGFLVRADLARTVGYKAPETVSDYFCDLDFGVRLALEAGASKFVYVDTFVTKYRQHRDTVTGRRAEKHNAYLMYQALLRMRIPERDRNTCEDVYQNLALHALRDYARMGKRREALKVFFSSHYAPRRLSRRGIYHFAMILCPTLYEWRQNLRLRSERAALAP